MMLLARMPVITAEQGRNDSVLHRRAPVPKPVPKPVRYLSGVGQVRTSKPFAVTPLFANGSGCQGLDSLRSSTPGNLCALVCPLACCSRPSNRIAPARFRISCQGYAPAPRIGQEPTTTERIDILAFSGFHILSRSQLFSGKVLRTCEVWVFSRSPVQHGSYDNSIGALATPSSGLRTTARQEASTVGFHSGTAVRCHRRESISRAGDRVFRVTLSDLYFPFPMIRMETNNKSKVSRKAATAPAVAGPVKVFLIDDVSSSVFAREVPTKSGQRTFYSVSFSRSFVDSKGVRRYVKTFDLDDLGKVVQVAQQADDYVRQLVD